MAFTSGTATGMVDLLDKFRIWVTAGPGWTQHNWSTPGESFLSLEFPGGGTGFEGFINIETIVGAGGEFCFRLWGADSYTAGAKENPVAQVGAFGGHYFNIIDTTMDYWFYANSRRAIIVAKCGSSYASCYMGFFNPFAFPSEYPRPYYICGNRSVISTPSDIDNANSFIAMPGDNAASAMYDGTAVIAHNMYEGGVSGRKIGGIDRTGVWPGMAAPAPASSGDSDNWSFGGFENMRLNYNDESPLFQCQLVSPDLALHLGALDGVYQVCGQGRSSNNTITNVGGQTFRLFQNGPRNSAGNFMAIEEA